MNSTHDRPPPGASHRSIFSARLVTLLVAFAISVLPATAEDLLEHSLGYCAKHGLFHDQAVLPEDSSGEPPEQKFAPDRVIDVLHLLLEITPDFKTRTIEGAATLTFTPISKPLSQLRLDARDLNVAAVDGSVPVADYHVADDHILITFENAIPPRDEVLLTVRYSAEPADGLFFRTPEMGYKAQDTHLWTQGEPERHRHWFPSYDYPNERFSTEMICHVPAEMTALSNGRLVSTTNNPDSGLLTFHWRQDKPHVNYLISLVAGRLKKLEDRYRDIPLALYTPPSEFAQAANSFRDTAKILEFFEKEIGVPYPWDKYYNICVQDFIAGGMENTSATTLTADTLFTKASENIRTTRPLDAHEIAHQWFGDLVTCKDWSHLWLNEGFATYYQVLYEEEQFGRDALLYGMFRNAERVLKSDDDRPIVYRGYRSPMEQFDTRAYPKGAWILHMLRSQLGPQLYRRCIKSYLKKHEFSSVVTEDLNETFEELSGKSLDRFFDQWVYHGGHPVLDIKYSWDGAIRQAKITVTQNQKLSDRVLLFQFPLAVRFITADGEHNFNLAIEKKTEDFYCRLPSQPKIVRIDPEFALLAKINFTPPKPLLHAQLESENDMMGRLLAIQILSKRKDRDAVEKAAHSLRSDPFYGVRIEAAKALEAMHTNEALDELMASLDQDDARVRQQVTQSIGRYYRDQARDRLIAVIKQESNPDIVTEAIRALGKFPEQEVSSHLLAALERPSYRGRIADAAIGAMRQQDQPIYLTAIFDRLQNAEASFSSDGFGRGLDALAYLARNQDENERDPVREFLAGKVHHPKEKTRIAAITALGTLEDPRSIALLETFPAEPKDRPENKAAAESIEKLNGKKTQAREVSDLRKETLELQKHLEKLQGEVKQLQKKVEPEKPEEKEDSKKQ